MPVNSPDTRPALVVLGLAGAAALLIVVTSNLLGVGAAVFPLVAGLLAYVALRRIGPSLVTALASVLLILPMLAIVVSGAYIVDSLVR